MHCRPGRSAWPVGRMEYDVASCCLPVPCWGGHPSVACSRRPLLTPDPPRRSDLRRRGVRRKQQNTHADMLQGVPD